MTDVIAASTAPASPVLVEAICDCPGARKVPIRLSTPGIFRLREALREPLEAELALLTYRCGSCRGTVVIKARHLLLDSS